MRSGHIFATIINLLFAFLLVALGIFIFIIPYAPEFRHYLVSFFQEGILDLKILGLTLVCIGLFLVIVFSYLHRKRYLVLMMGSKGTVSMDEVALHKYVQHYLREFFAGKDLDVQTTCIRGQIYVVADLPYVPYEEQKNVLEHIEQGLEKLFHKYLNYTEEFHFTVTFQDS